MGVGNLSVDGHSGITGEPAFGTADYDSGDTLRFVGGTGIGIAVSEGPSGPAVEISSTVTSRLYTYAAPGFTGLGSRASAMITSSVNNNITVTRSVSTTTIVTAKAMTSGHTYTVTIPTGDHIRNFTLVDSAPALHYRVLFIWSDPSFTANDSTLNGGAGGNLYIPSVSYGRVGSNATPDLTTDATDKFYELTGQNADIEFNVPSSGRLQYDIFPNTPAAAGAFKFLLFSF